ncbi:MAG: hypothetical protein JRN11_05720 [Nitrososphaerota archaeon]|nr:hypothetical protein [Nitrososphaerota archaeon]MDG7026230.1 hypothetical protein [Nitrososphaerota archaeon]
MSSRLWPGAGERKGRAKIALSVIAVSIILLSASYAILMPRPSSRTAPSTGPELTSQSDLSSQTSAVSSSSSTPSSSSSTATSASSALTITSSSGPSHLTVGSEWTNGTTITGLYAILYQSGAKVAAGYTPVEFSLNNGQQYQVEVEGYRSAYFQYWSGTNWVNASTNVSLSSSSSFDAVFCAGACSDGSTAPPPTDGVTVYANRIPAPYWASCFATVCSAGTGPGASMYFILKDSAGNVVQAGFADEWGLTFNGLAPGKTYYLYATSCDLCHGSTHDVVFNYWTGGTLGVSQETSNPLSVVAGTVAEAWFSCTNGCTGF